MCWEGVRGQPSPYLYLTLNILIKCRNFQPFVANPVVKYIEVNGLYEKNSSKSKVYVVKFHNSLILTFCQVYFLMRNDLSLLLTPSVPSFVKVKSTAWFHGPMYSIYMLSSKMLCLFKVFHWKCDFPMCPQVCWMVSPSRLVPCSYRTTCFFSKTYPEPLWQTLEIWPKQILPYTTLYCPPSPSPLPPSSLFDSSSLVTHTMTTINKFTGHTAVSGFSKNICVTFLGET